MAKRQPKTLSTTFIEVVGRPGGHKGRIGLTSGNFIYFRPGAQTETLRLTYQQLMAVLERELEYQSLDTAKVKLPKSLNKDFRMDVCTIDEFGDVEQLLSSSISKLDPMRITEGDYQFDDAMANGRKSKKHEWFAHVSIQAALWIINHYTDRFLVSKKMTDHTDKDIVISKQKMREVLLMLFKKINT